MFKTRDFYFKKVYNIRGKKIGIIEDLYIDFYQGKVVGFKVSNSILFSKKNYLDMQDIIDIGEDVIVNSIRQGEGLTFKEIKYMEVIDTLSNIKGVLEDIIIDIQDYSIKAIVISSGLIDKMIKGKQIIILNRCILGEEYILYTGNEGISFKSMPHNMEQYNATKKA
ncbi:photosystem reaction center subunit H [Clostridium gelidum]|uniref:Photosystem reaction center subunit H n=1 Tax=Clostridium gelidum TaxID=704125 RepID=A0ABM7T8D3_9CLOT|nr:PRC-barrel domain-containing protein [Clostridium gelidum]BCZ48232.1 photosystem reaction center subunit H [Clostridium gelidum]